MEKPFFFSWAPTPSFSLAAAQLALLLLAQPASPLCSAQWRRGPSIPTPSLPPQAQPNSRARTPGPSSPLLPGLLSIPSLFGPRAQGCHRPKAQSAPLPWPKSWPAQQPRPSSPEERNAPRQSRRRRPKEGHPRAPAPFPLGVRAVIHRRVSRCGHGRQGWTRCPWNPSLAPL